MSFCCKLLMRRWQGVRDINYVHTNTGTSHSLRTVATWAGAMVATSGILTDLVVSALMGAISALIDICKVLSKSEFINKISILLIQHLSFRRCNMTVSTDLHMSHWHLWSYHWGTGQYKCNLRGYFYTVDLIDKPAACTHLYLGWHQGEKKSQQIVLGESMWCYWLKKLSLYWSSKIVTIIMLSHLYSVGFWVESPAHRRSDNYQ